MNSGISQKPGFRFRLCAVGLCIAAAAADEPPGYYASTNGLTGPALRTELHRLVKTPHVPLTYSQTRGALENCDQDPANAGNVLLVYSRRSEPKTNFVHSPPQNGTEWNREHLWPDSRGVLGEGADYADLFNLRPADVTVNADRANLAFEETDAAAATVPGSAEALLTSRDVNSWEPPTVVKGDIARTLFYMALRYDGDASLELDLTLTDNMSLVSGSAPVMGRLTTLLHWHLADPVSAEERRRNDCVHQQQKNRNPFIDRPEWVEEVYGNPMLVTGSASGNQVTLTWWAGLENAVPQVSDSLQPASWSTVPGTPVTNGNFKTLITKAAGERKFYRVRFRGIEPP